MRLKVLVTAPVLSQSGYGEHGRFVLRALKTREDLFDIYVDALNWGRTSWLWEDTEERAWIDSLLMKTMQHAHQQGTYDLSLQVTIPNEWKKLAPINIGCTAGIETTKISPEWVKASYAVDKIIVVSNFSKEAFVNTVYEGTSPNTGEVREIQAKGPFGVVNYPFRPVDPAQVDFDFKYDFNFLAVAQWGPRKNLENTIRWFVEEFHDQEVGLVVKTSVGNNSYTDSEMTKLRIRNLLSDPKYANRVCSVHMIHGYLKDDEMSALYQDEKIKALVNIAHGEGYGLPMFEAAGYGKPIITIGWGGQTDFLYVPEKVKGKRKRQLMAKFAEVDYQLAHIQKEAVWNGVLQADSQWAYADPASYKMKLREVYKNLGMYEKRAATLKEHIRSKFAEGHIYNEFLKCAGLVKEEKQIPVKPISGLSFCIPTNGKRSDKTLLTIESIKSQDWGDVSYEINLCGDVESFKEVDGVNLIDRAEAAHSRKVSVLRNEAAANAKYENVVFCDDDIVLGADWAKNTLEFSNHTGWEVLGSRILNPDGTRHWDRSFLSPHLLVDYNVEPSDNRLYQTSGFFMIKKDVFENIKWDEERLVFADRLDGGVPEDVVFSQALIKGGIPLHFNEQSVVWHNDDSYTEWNNQTLLKSVISGLFENFLFLETSDEFVNTLKSLEVAS